MIKESQPEMMDATTDAAQPNFEDLVKYLSSLDYDRRRRELWHHQTSPRLPRFVYKFHSFDPSNKISVDQVRDVVVKSRLWLSSPADFNDPFDMKASVVINGSVASLRARFHKILKQRGMRRSERDKRVAEYMSKGMEHILLTLQREFETLRNSTGVCSFGGDPRSILMWSHYGANHKGVCFQFEIARDLVKLVALPVEYREEYPIFDWMNDNDNNITRALLTKHKGWSYEKEHRLIVRESAHRYINFSPDALTGVLIGCRAGDQTVDAFKAILRERAAAGHPALRIYHTAQHTSHYQLTIRRGEGIGRSQGVIMVGGPVRKWQRASAR